MPVIIFRKAINAKSLILLTFFVRLIIIYDSSKE